MLVTPAPRRSRVSDRPEGLEIVVPAKRSVFLMLFLLVWLGAWAVGEFSVLGQLLRGTEGPVPFLLFWLLGWTVGGGCALLTFLWMLAGRERIVLRPRVLAVYREIFGLGPIREYDLAHVRNLRVSPPAYDPFGWGAAGRFWGVTGGFVAFDYGAKTVRLAASADEPEAAQIVREITARHSVAQ